MFDVLIVLFWELKSTEEMFLENSETVILLFNLAISYLKHDNVTANYFAECTLRRKLCFKSVFIDLEQVVIM